MDEYNSGMDPEVKKYFRRIIKSFSAGLIWLIVITTAGIFFKLGELGNGAKVENIIFYVVFAISFLWLMWYYYKIWKDK
ncbi:MAG: hypothetical protein ACJ749_14485 [Flavisolibacter sp.]